MLDETAVAATQLSRMEPVTARSGLIARLDAFDNGFNADDIKRRVSRREWIVIRPGAYLQASEMPSLTPTQRHRLQIDAELSHASEHVVLSHLSAACEHGIDLIREPAKTVQVTDPVDATGHRRPLLHTHRATIDDDEWVLLREDRIRDAGFQVVRWTWDDLDRPTEVAARIRRALDRGVRARRSSVAPAS